MKCRWMLFRPFGLLLVKPAILQACMARARATNALPPKTARSDRLDSRTTPHVSVYCLYKEERGTRNGCRKSGNVIVHGVRWRTGVHKFTSSLAMPLYAATRRKPRWCMLCVFLFFCGWMISVGRLSGCGLRVRRESLVLARHRKTAVSGRCLASASFALSSGELIFGVLWCTLVSCPIKKGGSG